MKEVEVTLKFRVEVNTDNEEEFDDNDACSAADLATHEALTFVEGNVGRNLDEAVKTIVHVDGHGECSVRWPDLSGFTGFDIVKCEVVGP